MPVGQYNSMARQLYGTPRFRQAGSLDSRCSGARRRGWSPATLAIDKLGPWVKQGIQGTAGLRQPRLPAGPKCQPKCTAGAGLCCSSLCCLLLAVWWPVDSSLPACWAPALIQARAVSRRQMAVRRSPIPPQSRARRRRPCVMRQESRSRPQRTSRRMDPMNPPS